MNNMKKLIAFAIFVSPALLQAECKKHMAVADPAALRPFLGKDLNSPIVIDATNQTSVALFDKLGSGAKVISRMPAGSKALLLERDKKGGAFRVQITDPKSKTPQVGWVNKEYGKAVMLDTNSYQVCEAEPGHKNRGEDGQGKGKGQRNGGQGKKKSQG